MSNKSLQIKIPKHIYILAPRDIAISLHSMTQNMTIEDTHCKLGNGRDWRDQIGSDRDWTQSPCEDISLIMVLAEFHQEISPKIAIYEV